MNNGDQTDELLNNFDGRGSGIRDMRTLQAILIFTTAVLGLCAKVIISVHMSLTGFAILYLENNFDFIL